MAFGAQPPTGFPWLLRINSVFGDKIPAEAKKLDEKKFQLTVYQALERVPIGPAIETPSASFTSGQEYALTIYLKAAIWMYLLENEVGKEKVDAAFQHYFRLWKFKHPQTADMKAAFEQSLNLNLDAYFGLLHEHGKLVE